MARLSPGTVGAAPASQPRRRPFGVGHQHYTVRRVDFRNSLLSHALGENQLVGDTFTIGAETKAQAAIASPLPPLFAAPEPGVLPAARTVRFGGLNASNHFEPLPFAAGFPASGRHREIGRWRFQFYRQTEISLP